MNVDSAIALIGQLILKPGWFVTARDHTNRFEGAIIIKIDYPAANSNRDEAKLGYPTEIKTYAEFPMIVEDLATGEELYRPIIDAILFIEAHEWRESFRVLPTYWSPFHPHRADGIKRWGGDPRLDLYFGIA